MRRAVAIAALALLVLGACGSDDDDTTSGSGTGTGSGTGSEAAAPVELSGKVNEEGTGDATGKDDFTLEADDFYFGPTYIKVTSGQKLKLEIENEGEATHTFTSAALGVDQEIKPGQKVTVAVTVPDAEAVEFHCRFHQGSGMQGALYTKEGAKVSGSETTSPTSEPTVTGGASSSGY